MAIPREQFKEAYGKLPEPIRAYLASDELGLVSEEIGRAQGLHVDAIGVLSEILTRTLLGMVSPQELPTTLTNSLGIDAQRTNVILTSTNDRIFIPLQKRVREFAEQEAKDREAEARLAELDKSSSEPIPVPEQRPEPIPAPKIEYAPPVQTNPSPVTLPGSPAPAPMPAERMPVAQPQSTSLPVAAVNHFPVEAPQTVSPHVGHAPGWHPAAAVHIFVPTQTHSAPHAQAQAVPVSSLPNEPQAPAPAPSQPVSRPIIEAPAPKTSQETRPYSSDPYREPI